MILEELKQVIIDQQSSLELFLKNNKIIPRGIDQAKLLSFLRYPNILVITGPRRAGKSILSASLLTGKKFGYINFDDERLLTLETKDLNLLLQAFLEIYGADLEYFIFDEIQNISGWQLFVSRLRQNKKIIITGSNAKLLSGELATNLTGRYVSFTLYPFSFMEYRRWTWPDGSWIEPNNSNNKKQTYSTEETAQIRNQLNNYLQSGGFPEVLLFGAEFAKHIYSDIVEKDILYRHKIRNQKTFKELARYLLSNSGQLASYAKLKNIFSVKSVITMKNYFDYLSVSFLIFGLEKFSFKLKQQFISPRKIYAIDTGLVQAVSFQFSPNSGHIKENAVFLQLLRQQSYQADGSEIFYWQDYQGHEVDFVRKIDQKVTELIQVTGDLEDPQTKKREIKALLLGSVELRCVKLTVITDNFAGTEEIAGKKIEYVPLWRWLMD